MKRFLLFSFLKCLGYLFLYMPHFLRLGFAKTIALILFCLIEGVNLIFLQTLILPMITPFLPCKKRNFKNQLSQFGL